MLKLPSLSSPLSIPDSQSYYGAALEFSTGQPFFLVMRIMSFSGKNLICYRASRKVFEGVHFEVGPGEVLFLTGANGSGKSSLLRIMAGLLPPFDGGIFWQNENIANDRDAHNDRMVLVTQEDPVKPAMTALEHLAFWGKLAGADVAEKKLWMALEKTGMARWAHTDGRFLSAGQKRRLNLARIFLKDYRLWLLDEPVTALDEDSSRLFRAELDRHIASGGLAVVASHDQEKISEGRKRLGL